jgi:hypothetical protein
MATVANNTNTTISAGDTVVTAPTLGQSIGGTVSATPLTPTAVSAVSTTPSATTGIPSVLQTPAVTPATTPPVTTPAAATAVSTVTPTTGVPSVLQQPTASAVTTPPISSTGIPAGWKVEDYQKDYSAEYNRIKALNPNDPRLPVIQAARATKIAGMTDEQLQAAGVDRQGNPLPKPAAVAKPAATTTPVKLGVLSAKYESNGNPATISTGTGDLGGKSYGTYQFASKTGSLLAFVNSLKATNPDMYNQLYGAYTKGGIGFGANFDAAWKAIAAKNPAAFESVQHDYIQKQYYNPASDKLKEIGLDLSKHSPALQDVVWSTAVQHGVNGAINLFKKIDLSGTDADIINRLYDERSNVGKYFSGSSSAVQAGVKNRFAQERKDALAMLAKQPTAAEAKPETQPATSKPSATEPVSTRNLQSVNAAPTGQVALADELKKAGIDVQWDATTGQIKVAGQTLKGSDLPNASIFEGHTYTSPEAVQALVSKYGAPKEPTAVTQADGTTKTYTNEATGKVWNIADYQGDYSAEWNRIVKMNPTDPRLNMIDQARADKVLANAAKYPELVQWANDVKNGTWKAEDWKGNYQGEIDRLRGTNPADPRISQLEHLYAGQILADKSGKYQQAQKDWAIDMDKDGWKAGDYAADYSAEINRIKAFNPNDPRIQQLSDLRALKILANPGAYSKEMVTEAQKYQETRGDQLQQIEQDRGYTEAEVQADLETQKAIQRIKDYYKGVGLGTGGQAAADIKQAAIAGAGKVQGLESERVKSKSALIAQQAVNKAKQAILDAQNAAAAAKTDAQLQTANIALQKAQVGYQESLIGLQKAQVSLQSAQTSASKSASKAAAPKAASASQYNSYLDYYSNKLEDPSSGFFGIGAKDGNHSEIIDEVLSDSSLTEAQQEQMLMDLGLYDEAVGG